MGLIRQYDEKNYYFWVICNILSLLNLSNLNVYVINTCWFDLFSHVLITMSRSSNKDMTSIILDRMAENNTYG